MEDIPIKKGRHRYFKMLIYMGGLAGKKVNLWIDNNTLNKILKLNGLISQQVLEKTLYDLNIFDRGRSIMFQNFEGQLERDERTGVPYWKISLETKSLITGRRISREIYNKFGVEYSIIKIFPTTSFEIMKKEKRFYLAESDWYPGYFNKQILNLLELLSKREIKDTIRDAPEKYRLLISDLFEEV
jgi:hypothetical protein